MNKVIIIIPLLLTFTSALARNNKIKKFTKAKKEISKIYGRRGISFYCGCEYNRKKIKHSTCGYKFSKYKKRSEKLEWEHIVPAHAFGQSFKSWRDGDPKCKNRKKSYKGRKCARKIDNLFNFMESDLYNLVPAVGSINAYRSNKSMAMITDSTFESFGQCQVKISKSKIEPPNNRKGDIARIYQYMDLAYPGHGIISNKNEKLFKAWDEQDPVSRDECLHHEKIAKTQGNINKITFDRCQLILKPKT